MNRCVYTGFSETSVRTNIRQTTLVGDNGRRAEGYFHPPTLHMKDWSGGDVRQGINVEDMLRLEWTLCGSLLIHAFDPLVERQIVCSQVKALTDFAINSHFLILSWKKAEKLQKSLLFLETRVCIVQTRWTLLTRVLLLVIHVLLL